MIYNVKNVYKKYHNNMIINNFNYSFSSGLYLLIGRNGIGKSTLLKIMAKIISPSNINFSVDKIKVSYMCEKIELVNTKPSSFLKTICKINKRKSDIKKDLDIWKVPNRKINNLSKGNKQKVAILMMKYTDADLYLFDEPTDSLDKDGLVLFSEFIKELLKNEKIVVISTHEPSYFSTIAYKEISLC